RAPVDLAVVQDRALAPFRRADPAAGRPLRPDRSGVEVLPAARVRRSGSLYPGADRAEPGADDLYGRGAAAEPGGPEQLHARDAPCPRRARPAAAPDPRTAASFPGAA